MSPASARTLKIVAFGDSLTAGYELPADAAFPSVLERALHKDGFDVSVANAGVSGDTTSGGLERLDWSVPDGTDLTIVELGANDMLRGIDPAVTRTALDGIVSGLVKRGSKVLLTGMYASPSLDSTYREQFAAIFPGLAKRYDVPLYPFFLTGIIGQAGPASLRRPAPERGRGRCPRGQHPAHRGGRSAQHGSQRVSERSGEGSSLSLHREA